MPTANHPTRKPCRRTRTTALDFAPRFCCNRSLPKTLNLFPSRTPATALDTSHARIPQRRALNSSMMPGRTKNLDACSQDAAMQDAPPSVKPRENQNAAMEDQLPEKAEAEEAEAQRVKILPGSTDSAASFEFLDEGHTVGNALRYVIMKKLTLSSPDVEFCAYAIPHPSEAKMNIRIQMYEGTAVDALKKGLIDLQNMCDVVADEFWTKRNAFNAQRGITR